MHIPVLIQPVAGNGYRATGGQPFGFSAEGATRDEALQKLQLTIQDQLGTGAEIVSLEVPGVEHPLARFAGMFKDDPLFDEWQAAIAEHRRQADEDPDVP
jgi:predicted RNase H-like HicB family nuclease